MTQKGKQMFGLKSKSAVKVVETSWREMLKEPAPSAYPRSAPIPAPVEPLLDLAEYAAIAADVGVTPPDMVIEGFKLFLREHDIPVFNLGEVVRYMDKKAAAESKNGLGWEWRPLRAADSDLLHGVQFGNRAEDWGDRRSNTPASDYFYGAHDEFLRFAVSVSGTYPVRASSLPYDHTIPIHALRKVALVEKSRFQGKVAFMVNDYALKAHIVNPDPFLMAVIPNASLDRGVGRFVIDFWDEPGFGVALMVK
jgi:hypothetical protein